MTDWQAIDTAPKDGTIVLAYNARGIMTAYWGRSNPLNRAAWLGGHCGIDHIDQPTHWMPLPEPPK
jgi:hypothetical protein